jgi:hypothetical protein
MLGAVGAPSDWSLTSATTENNLRKYPGMFKCVTMRRTVSEHVATRCERRLVIGLESPGLGSVPR